MDAIAVARVQSIDVWYGVLAGLILTIGFARGIFATKGWGYYAHNAFFGPRSGRSRPLVPLGSTDAGLVEMAAPKHFAGG